jgi:hypothetical protein
MRTVFQIHFIWNKIKVDSMCSDKIMEDKLDESSNFKLLDYKNSKEDLLWVTQKVDTMTTFRCQRT